MSSAIPTQPSMQLPRGARISVLISVIVPPLALITVMWLAWGSGFGVLDLSIFAGMYLICGWDHRRFPRYFTHKSFDCPRWVKYMLGITGSMACRGSLLWCAIHRQHHRHSDEDHDPTRLMSGVVTSETLHLPHLGWLFKIEQPDQARYIRISGPTRTISSSATSSPSGCC